MYHYMLGTKVLRETFRARESLLNLHAVPSFFCMTGWVHPLCVISRGRIKEINGQIPGAA